MGADLPCFVSTQSYNWTHVPALFEAQRDATSKRSGAPMNLDRRQRPRCAALLALVLLANLVAAQPAPAASVIADGDAVIFKGRIDAGSTAQFLSLLQTPTITRLVITSGGGDVAAALDMAEAIHVRQLDIEVPSVCLSSCANYVFPAGRRKTLGRPDAVGWHGNMAHVLFLQDSGRQHWSDTQIASARLLAAREADFYSRIGVDGFVCWFGKMAPYDVEDFYWLSADDMARFDIQDVILLTPMSGVTANPEVREIRVDGDTLERARRHARPSVQPPA